MSLSPVAKAFLASILTIKNTIISDHSEDCCICQERYGTLSPETGNMELEIRLPCNHTVGSACIAIWLSDNNTCPLCRYEFFPHEPASYIEHETIEAIAEEWFNIRPRTQDSESHDDPLKFAAMYAQRLSLGGFVTLLALDIADTAWCIDALRFSTSESIAAASVYIASHILNQPRSLTDVARLAAVSERTTHNVYRAIHRDRYQLINDYWCQIVGGTTLGEAAEALPSLTWPPLQQAHIEDENSDMEPSAIGDLDLVRRLCTELHEDADGSLELGSENPALSMAHSVADRMNTMGINWRTTNPWTIAAACAYMVSHLVLQGKTLEEVSLMCGIPSASVSNTYQVMYEHREHLVREASFETFFWSRKSALGCLPKP